MSTGREYIFLYSTRSSSDRMKLSLKFMFYRVSKLFIARLGKAFVESEMKSTYSLNMLGQLSETLNRKIRILLYPNHSSRNVMKRLLS